MRKARTRRITHDTNYMNTKLLTFSLAFGMVCAAPLALAHDNRHDQYDHDTQGASLRALRAELDHTHSTYNHVYGQLDRYDASKHVREEMKHINAEYNHVGGELNSGRFDTDHVRDEIAHIHDALHHVDQELHDRGDRKSDQRKGVTIRFGR